MLRRPALVLLMMSLAPACGRTAMGALPPAVDGGAPFDAPMTADAQLPADTQFLADGWLPSDVQVALDLAPASGCAALQPLADGVVTARHAARALFAPDRSSLVLRVKGEAPPGSQVDDDLLLVRLPSGEVSPIIISITSAEWLQPGATLLVTVARDGGSDLVVVNSDGGGMRTLVQSVCAHVAAPDGSRVYAVHDCDAHKTGAMDVIDVASGASTRLAIGASFATPTPTRATAVSPDGRWVAFLASSPGVVVVADADGLMETLAPESGAFAPAFVSNSLLLFAAGSPHWESDIRGHVPGTGDASYLIAANRDPGLFGYQVSPDKTWVLGAIEMTSFVDQLYAERLDGSGELLLASDLYDFNTNEVALRVFAFSAGGRVLYNANRPMDVATVGLDGGIPTALSADAWFLETPRLDQVVLAERASLTQAATRLRLVDLASETDVLSHGSDGGIGAVGFPTSSNGLVFVAYRSPDPTQLRYASANQSVVLGQWQVSQFLPDSLSDQFWPQITTYPVDPTGCFTVFDTDLAPGPGTRLAILPQ